MISLGFYAVSCNIGDLASTTLGMVPDDQYLELAALLEIRGAVKLGLPNC
jgi:hypothetical protein